MRAVAWRCQRATHLTPPPVAHTHPQVADNVTAEHLEKLEKEFFETTMPPPEPAAAADAA